MNKSKSAKLQILLNRVPEKDFKAEMEVEAFASQSTVEELFDAYKQVDLRVKKSSKELERYYYNNYYSFIESAREQIDTTNLLEKVNNKLAHQYIPLIEEINSSFEGIRDQLADELLRYEQLKKYSTAKKQSGWVIDLFVNLEKSYHRIKGLTAQQVKEVVFKDINYKVYGYIIRCAYHIKNFYLLFQYQHTSSNAEIKVIVDKCMPVLVRLSTLFDTLLTSHCCYSGSWSLDYPILLVIHTFLIQMNIESSLPAKMESRMSSIFQFYGSLYSKFTMDQSTSNLFIKMRNTILKDVCLFSATLDSTMIPLDPLLCESSTIKTIYNHLAQINQLLPVELHDTFQSYSEPLLKLLPSLITSCYTPLFQFSLIKDFLGENFNSNKLIHFLFNLKSECFNMAHKPLDFLWSIDKQAMLQVDENNLTLALDPSSKVTVTQFPISMTLHASTGNSLMSIYINEAINSSFSEVVVKFKAALFSCLSFKTPKELAVGLLETERVLDKTLTDTVYNQLLKLLKLTQDLFFQPFTNDSFQSTILSQLHLLYTQLHLHISSDPNSKLILSRICFDAELHLIQHCFLTYLPLYTINLIEPDVDNPSKLKQLYSTLDLGVPALRTHLHQNAQQLLGHFIQYHCHHCSVLMIQWLTDLEKQQPQLSISPMLVQTINYLTHIEEMASVIFDEQGAKDLFQHQPKKGHAKKYSLDDRFSDRESVSSGLSPTKPEFSSGTLPKTSYLSHVHKLFRKHVDYYPQLPTDLKSSLQLRIHFTKEALMEHLLLTIIKCMIEGIKNRMTLFHSIALQGWQYEQVIIDVDYLKMVLKLSATELQVLDDKFLMILLDELKSYVHLNCTSPKSPDTKTLQGLLDKERVKLSRK